MAEQQETMSSVGSGANKVVDYPIISFMVAAHVIAFWSLFYFSWQNFAVMMVMWFVAGCLGITLGFHRLLTHRSFRVPKWLERTFATCGVLALQGSPLMWVGHHRMHHAGSDTPKDPHNALRGFWFCHIGWLFVYEKEFNETKNLRRFARDITADPYYRWLESNGSMLGIQALLGVLLYAWGGFSAVGWGIFVRLVVGYHITWFVNSAAHMWGYQTYESGDSSRNNWWVGLLAFGEGWHNNHHAFGNVAPAGHKWYEVDLTFAIIRTLGLLGLATHINELPDEATRQAAMKKKIQVDANADQAGPVVAKPSASATTP